MKQGNEPCTIGLQSDNVNWLVVQAFTVVEGSLLYSAPESSAEGTFGMVNILLALEVCVEPKKYEPSLVFLSMYAGMDPTSITSYSSHWKS